MSSLQNHNEPKTKVKFTKEHKQFTMTGPKLANLNYTVVEGLSHYHDGRSAQSTIFCDLMCLGRVPMTDSFFVFHVINRLFFQ